jgi:hypothetical protein
MHLLKPRKTRTSPKEQGQSSKQRDIDPSMPSPCTFYTCIGVLSNEITLNFNEKNGFYFLFFLF